MGPRRIGLGSLAAVVAEVPPGAGQNAEARRLADAAGVCVPSPG